MSMVDALLPEFDHEMSVTRKLLERVPQEKADWKPHVKSMSLGQLAQHVATLPMWGSLTLNQQEFDLGDNPPNPPMQTRADLLATFDRLVADTRGALAGKTDPELLMPWTLKKDGHTIFSMPKASVWRSFVISHLVHHRGQLSVYLRLNEVSVPSIYGPSADEGQM
jgi:uncharacterized damage-inducible protein DinB